MMREPPGLPSTRNDLAVLFDEGRRHRGERPFAGCDRVGLALHQAVHVRRAGLGGEIVHLVVEQKAGAGRDHPGAEIAVDRIGHGDRVAGAVDHRIMRRLGPLVRGRRSAPRRRFAAGDRGADAGRIALRQQPVERVRDKGRVAEIGCCGRRSRGASPRPSARPSAPSAKPIAFQVVAFEDVQDFADRRPARARRRRRHDHIAAIGAGERRPLGHRVIGKIARGQDAAIGAARPRRPQRRPARYKTRPGPFRRSPRASRRGPFARDGRRAANGPPSGRRKILAAAGSCAKSLGLGVEQPRRRRGSAQTRRAPRRSPAPSPPRAAACRIRAARGRAPCTVPGTPTARQP